MSSHAGPTIVTSGLILDLDVANPKSYPGTGTAWNDLSGNGNHFTLDGTITYNATGYFDLVSGGATRTSAALTASTTSTIVYWIRTTDVQSLFLTASNGGFLGAYRVDNVYYNSSCGTPTYWLDKVSKSDIYADIRDDVWHMVEFKSVDISAWSNLQFNKYSAYTFGSGAIGAILIYNRNLTTNESQQNFNARRKRYGV